MTGYSNMQAMETAQDVGDVGRGALAVYPVLTLVRITMATRGVAPKLTSQPQEETQDYKLAGDDKRP